MSSPTEARVRRLLADVYTAEDIAVWMDRRNRLLGGESPAALIERGEGEWVLAFVQRLHARSRS